MELYATEGTAMSEATTISAMLKSISRGPAWHGPSVMESLEGVSVSHAMQKPLAGAHSIWEILLHMIAWQEYALNVADGADGAALQGKADWPPVPAIPAEDEWETAQRHFEGCGQEIRELIMHFDDAKMHETVPGREFPMKVLLHGIVHHNLYHCGQIGVLKKAL